MQEYMPRHHRAFLNHLAHTPRPLRDFVLSKFKESPDGEKLLQAYNAAVQELKVFRDKHMIIVALYIIGPARRREAGTRDPSSGKEELKGTGGTNMVQFLKDRVVPGRKDEELVGPSPPLIYSEFASLSKARWPSGLWRVTQAQAYLDNEVAFSWEYSRVGSNPTLVIPFESLLNLDETFFTPTIVQERREEEKVIFLNFFE
ncbi:hypothetical protein NMY22_g15618 [Coprinellus aureogranulatus]|nr:hypothetical protein NMY22_g15618 [Coprinellus aureogranulatus]